jgi:release factor glutamine methyltransferase
MELTVIDLITRTADFLASKGVPNPKLDAELIVAHGLGCRRLDLFLRFDQNIPEGKLAELRSLVFRRGSREPLQYIIGSVDWAGLKLKVDRRALIPRPETEQLWELIDEDFKSQGKTPSRILDLGTGSGALALALKKSFPNALVVATDQSPEALALARENSEALKLKIDLREGSWFAPISPDEKFDLIVSNPPYLTDAETASAEPEVNHFEPISALRADDEGFADIAEIMACAQNRLNEEGILWLETGIAHASKIRELGAGLAYSQIEGYKDYERRDRFARLWVK